MTKPQPHHRARHARRRLHRLHYAAICAISFLLVLLHFGAPHQARPKPTLALVVPATGDDYQCFAAHLVKCLLKMTSLPEEVIFVVSGWVDGFGSAAHLKQLEELTDVQVLRYAHKQNQATNRNLGAAVSRTDYVFFFDIDDVLHTSVFSILRHALSPTTTNFDAAMFSHGPFTTLNHFQMLPKKPLCITSRKPCADIPVYTSTALFRELFMHWFAEYAWSYESHHLCCQEHPHRSLAPGWLLVNRTSFLSHGVFDDRISRGEDGNQIARMIASGLSVIYIDTEIGYYNRDHTNPPCQSDVRR